VPVRRSPYTRYAWLAFANDLDASFASGLCLRKHPYDARCGVAVFLHGGDDEVGAAGAVAAGVDALIRGLAWAHRICRFDPQRMMRRRCRDDLHAAFVVQGRVLVHVVLAAHDAPVLYQERPRWQRVAQTLSGQQVRRMRRRRHAP
jgi:hypothetical protein